MFVIVFILKQVKQKNSILKSINIILSYTIDILLFKFYVINNIFKIVKNILRNKTNFQLTSI